MKSLQAASVFIAVIMVGCSQPERETARPFSSIGNPVLRERMEKDREFRTGRNSPISGEDRANFHGLSYFELNPNLRFRVKLNRYPAPQTVRLGTNTGEIRSALRYGYFEFRVDGRDCRLQVYRIEDVPSGGGPNLFIPFRDATSGKETYGAGRYIDLQENTSGYYDLDFNRAYNPYCAYAKGFSCPVPPAENTLTVPIRAGEMKYPLSEEHALSGG
jgi:uncharacterized protein (DUF1684 family)